MTIRIAIIGYGKIARDQHCPSIAANPDIELAAIASSSGDPGLGIPWFATAQELFAAMPGKVDAVAICTPPLPRHDIARDALIAGYDALLEKPPAATLGEVEHLERLARDNGRTLYATWHSQHAAGVDRAAALLKGETIASFRIEWREDVRKWHPGQEWVWAPGGFGVFDPGINALSISTRILPVPLFVREAKLLVPANKQAPIAAALTFAGEAMTGEFDWRHGEDERWTIHVETASGRRIELRRGGEALLVDGVEQTLESIGEYPSIYRRFAELVSTRTSEVDKEPLRIVADAFLVGRRDPADPFV
jgi:D-galactose 1-dehydrogenase